MNATAQHYKFSDITSNQALELYVSTCINPPHNFNVHNENRADFFSVAIVVQGQAKIKQNLKEYHIAKNSVLFSVPNTINQVIEKSDDISIYSVIFTSKFLLQTGLSNQEMETMNFSSANRNEIITLNDTELHLLKKTIKDLKSKTDNAASHPFGEDIVKYSFRIFLSEMAAIAVNHKLIITQKNTRKQNLVIQFNKLVNNHFMKNRSVKFYADQLAITPKYLTEIVHEVTGEPASALIDEKVMYEARLLLNNPQLSIAQIAETLNFSDQSFLGKFFKRHLGLSPTQYRNHKLI